MDIYVSHVRRKQLPSYVYPEGYKRPRRQVNQQSEKICDDAEGDSCGSADRGLKRRTDSESGNLTPSRLEKRASVSPQRLESFSPEVSSRFCGPSPLRYGEVAKPDYELEGQLLGKSQVTLSSEQLDADKGMNSYDMQLDKGNYNAISSIQQDSSDACSVHMVGEEVIASLNICDRIKDSCLVKNNEENTGKFVSSTFENSEIRSFQRAGDLIESAAQNDIHEVVDHYEQNKEGLKSGLTFESNGDIQTLVNEDDVCRGDSSLLLDNGCLSGSNVCQGGSTEEMEPGTAVGMAIETQGRINDCPRIWTEANNKLNQNQRPCI